MAASWMCSCFPISCGGARPRPWRGFRLWVQAEILSGDREAPVSALARDLGVEDFVAGVRPRGKVDRVKALAAAGGKPLMVGDGLNDAPALSAAHVSMAPASAADVGRMAADFVFLHDSLEAVPLAIEVSRKAGQLIRQNFALAILYNCIAVPAAVLGHATPLIAALAMSSSSVIVVLNSLRLRRTRPGSRRLRSPDPGACRLRGLPISIPGLEYRHEQSDFPDSDRACFWAPGIGGLLVVDEERAV
jgi:hypothetical protein